jgi:hypothetical protein
MCIRDSNYVHHPSFQHVSILPDELKEQLLNNINHLNEFELERLKTELYSNEEENGIDKFINFIKLLDKKRNVYIGDYLKEWDIYFKEQI